MAHQITPVEGDLVDLLNKTCKVHVSAGALKVDGFFFPARYEKFADAIENFEVYDDDIWVCSFPKGGTTWTQEMVWCIANDLDFEGAMVPLPERFPFFELSIVIDVTPVMEQDCDAKPPPLAIDSVSFVENLPRPRFIKTHLPFNLLPRQLRTGEKKPKIIYTVRNPKDTCISFFHHSVLIDGFAGSFEDFCNLFLGNMAEYTPFWEHVFSYSERRIDENLLFLKYEDMQRDLPWVIKKTAKFLGKNLTTDQLSTLTQHLSFASMKKNPAVNNEHSIAVAQKVNDCPSEGKFMRSGTSDQWKTVMSPEDVQRFDVWTRECSKGTRL